MLTFLIIFLILLGLFLLFLEFFVTPGMTVAGIGGLIFITAGISIVYKNYGSSTGHIVLLSTIIFGIILFVISFKSGTWDRLALKSTISGQVGTISDETIHPGDTGITVTRLNPIGKVKVNDEIVEAKCPGQFVDPNTEVIIKEVNKTQIIVKLK